MLKFYFRGIGTILKLDDWIDFSSSIWCKFVIGAFRILLLDNLEISEHDIIYQTTPFQLEILS